VLVLPITEGGRRRDQGILTQNAYARVKSRNPDDALVYVGKGGVRPQVRHYKALDALVAPSFACFARLVRLLPVCFSGVGRSLELFSKDDVKGLDNGGFTVISCPE